MKSSWQIVDDEILQKTKTVNYLKLYHTVIIFIFSCYCWMSLNAWYSLNKISINTEYIIRKLSTSLIILWRTHKVRSKEKKYAYLLTYVCIDIKVSLNIMEVVMFGVRRCTEMRHKYHNKNWERRLLIAFELLQADAWRK